MSKQRREYHKAYRQHYRGKRVNLTLSPDEYRAFSRASHNQKLTPFIKQLALSALEQQATIPESLEAELKTLRFAIRNIANNVNQIAHYSNTIRNLTSAEENNLLLHIKQLEAVVQAYTEGRILQAKGDDN